MVPRTSELYQLPIYAFNTTIESTQLHALWAGQLPRPMPKELFEMFRHVCKNARVLARVLLFQGINYYRVRV